MAVVILESLVLRGGVPVMGNVAAGSAQVGSNPAKGQPPVLLSMLREPIPGIRPTGATANGRRDSAGRPGQDSADRRAGRSECFAGFLESRSSASLAGRTVLWGQSPNAGGPLPTAADRSGPMPRTPATSGK